MKDTKLAGINLSKLLCATDGLLARIEPARVVLIGYFLYVLIGWALLSLPLAVVSSVSHIPDLHHLFTAVSAVSTTGLSIVNVPETYTFFGQLVILLLIQLGGLGYMTLSSFVVISSSKRLSDFREKMTKQTFPLPHDFNVAEFVKQAVIFSVAIELIGAVVLSVIFFQKGVAHPIWQGIFHSISAYCTAGFSLFSTGFEPYATDTWIPLTLTVLSYCGGIGFIVWMDIVQCLTGKKAQTTFTTKVILSITFWFMVVGTLLLLAIEPFIQRLPMIDRIGVAIFQVMSASTTVGFNTLPIGSLSMASLLIIIFLMIFGASPSGTGGGLKSTTFSALIGLIKSVLKGRDSIRFLKRTIPEERLHTALAAFGFYMLLLFVGLLLLVITDSQLGFLSLLFESISAMSTVGLSTGITSSLSAFGHLVIILLMFIGRLGVLTFGLAISTKDESLAQINENELVVS